MVEHPAVNDLEARQPSALPPHSTRDSLHPSTRRSERERRRPGKYSDYMVTYSGLPQKFVFSQKCWNQAGQCHRATASIAHPVQSEKEHVELQQISEHSNWGRSARGKCELASVKRYQSVAVISSTDSKPKALKNTNGMQPCVIFWHWRRSCNCRAIWMRKKSVFSSHKDSVTIEH